MRYILIAAIGMLVVMAAVLPASALPVAGEIDGFGLVRTGVVYVTLTDIDGNETSQNVAIAYDVGNVFELPVSAVYADTVSGIVTVTTTESTPARRFALVQRNTGNDTYYVRSVVVAASESDPLLVNGMSFAAAPSVSNYYADAVPEGKQHEWIDLDWKDPGKDLDLTVYAPDETFGPFTDTSDGQKDGRIFLDVSSRLNVTAGSWFFRVRNSLTDYIPYSLNTYSA